MARSNNVPLGIYGEEIASKYLQSHGYKILKRNFKHSNGEIDIVAKDKETLVFIEVKTRKGYTYGSPEESITKRKLGFLTRSAYFYLLLHPAQFRAIRIDVVCITLSDMNIPQTVTLYKNVTG